MTTLAPFFTASAMRASTFSTAFLSMSGPITAPGSNPSATFIAPAVSARRLVKASSTPSCTRVRVRAQAGSLGKRVFINRAILHNDEEILVGVFDESDVFQRIAVDQQQIRKRAFFHHTKLAWIGIDETGKGH